MVDSYFRIYFWSNMKYIFFCDNFVEYVFYIIIILFDKTEVSKDVFLFFSLVDDKI